MRSAAFALPLLSLLSSLPLAACMRPPPPDAGPPLSYPTLEPDTPFDPRPIGLADLQSIAGAASIALEIGPAPLLRTQSCDGFRPGADSGTARAAGKCYQCTLAVFGSAPGEPLHPLEVPLRTLATTLLAYPHSFLRAAHIERIALCVKLVDAAALAPSPAAPAPTLAATPAPSAAPAPGIEPTEHVAGLAEVLAHRLMVNLDHRDLAHPDATLHHEIFHLFDQATSPTGDHHHDAEWERINPRTFRYADATTASIQAGFVNDYAKTNPAEDKASVFEYVMGYPTEFCARGVDDPLLLAKARLLLSRIDAAVPPGMGEFATRKVPCLARR